MTGKRTAESVDVRALTTLQKALAGAGTIEHHPGDVPALHLPNGTMVTLAAGRYDVWTDHGREPLSFGNTLEQACKLVRP